MSLGVLGDYAPLLKHPFVTFVRRHWTATAALVTFSAILGRLLGVSDFDPSVALAIAGYADPPKVILGMVIDLSAVLFLALAMGLVLIVATTEAGQKPFIPRQVVGIVLVFVVLSSPVAIVAALALYTLLVLLIRGRPPTQRSTVSGWLLAAMVALAGAVVLTPVPWASAERIEAGDDSIVGYVLGFSGEWASVLDDADRRLIMVRQETITARIPCRVRPRRVLPDWAHQSLLALLVGRQPVLERCEASG